MDDFFLIDIPVFMPLYNTEKKYGWTKYKDELWQLLSDTTGGYCMYCFDSILINGQRRGQIEHGIEKSNSLTRLTDCVPNLGIACEICNDSYKRRGELKRKLPEESIKEFEKEECLKYDCKKACARFLNLRREYVRKGKILLQPFINKSDETGYELKIQYDLLKCKYIPSQSYEGYNTEDIATIEAHIKQFGLNSAERKNYEIARYCKNVIDNESVMKSVKYNNMIVDLFREKLIRLEITEAIKVCKAVYSSAFYKLST